MISDLYKLPVPGHVLYLDIETKPAIVYTWGLFKANIGIEQIIEPGGIICVGAKWSGEDECLFFSEWEDGHGEMLRRVHALMCEADAIVTYNGEKFDIPKLMGEFLREGLPPPPPPTSIDVWKTTRNLGFDSSRLGFVAPHLRVGEKMEHEGFRMWAKVLNGDPDARQRMKLYCMQDVIELEKLYLKARPYIKTHPHMADTGGHHCGSCGSHHLHSRGYRRTKMYKTQRLQCQVCGSWSLGTRTRVEG